MRIISRILLFVAVLMIAGVVGIALLTPWMDRWGATDTEISAVFPGDELVSEPLSIVNRAVTIQATPEQIYPWIIQLGAGRGGFYSYTWLETYLLRCPLNNADRIHPEWQNLSLGDEVKMCPGEPAPPPYTVAQVEPNRAVVLGHQENGKWVDLWQFVLIPQPDGTSRLILRTRTMMTGGFWTVIHPGVFIMERGMLLGIRERAEAAAAFLVAASTSQPVAATPELITPTPEIFIARTQAIPGPETFDLPAPCVSAGFATYASLSDGYCFTIPSDFSLELDSGLSVSSGPLDASLQPITVEAGILVQPAGEKTLDALVDAYLAEVVGSNPPWDIPRTGLSFRTEPGRLLDPVPGLGSSRVVFILHNGKSYTLTFYPSPLNPDGSLNTSPGDMSYDKLQALYEAIMNSFSFLGDPADPVSTIAVPVSCLVPGQPLLIDADTGHCAPGSNPVAP